MFGPLVSLVGLVLITTAAPAHPESKISQQQPILVAQSRPALLVRVQARLDAPDAVFEETETILALAPARQVDWARAYASGAGRRSTAQEIQAAIRESFPHDPPGMRAQTHLILQLILMGDIVGALRSYTVQAEQDQRQFSRLIVGKLNAVRRARSAVIRSFAQQRPPRAYAGAGPAQATRAQDRAARYTQFVRTSTQLMGELQNTERDLVDMLDAMDRDLQSLWQTYASMRDSDFRSNERVIITR